MLTQFHHLCWVRHHNVKVWSVSGCPNELVFGLLKRNSFLNGPFPASFSLFSSLLDNNWQINTFEILPMSGFKLWISGSDRSVNCATTMALVTKSLFYKLTSLSSFWYDFSQWRETKYGLFIIFPEVQLCRKFGRRNEISSSRFSSEVEFLFSITVSNFLF